ncbi:hypothetical protein [Butyrivibrio sp. YAB3001]|uniref:hypothetical protein n=1 Tax=Butyrivibrio sp. YAB3001 TaxID=1520812 RepID=UPI0008F627F8|nr:hypothetical protein [Butyrivibrio sp. YAB3001]SFB67302.1 hypothetical protein SAMN02910398_00115 [Butyrivibrio sp. YAB3001]
MNKKAISRFIACMMAFVLLFAISPAVTSLAANEITETRVSYFTSKNHGTAYHSYSVYNAKKITNIKSSKKAVVEPTGYHLSNSSSKYTYFDVNGKQTNQSSSSSKYAYVTATVKKAGTAVLTFKDDQKRSYKWTFKVYNYENPVKTFKVARKGVTSKNYAGYFKDSTSASKSITIDKNGVVNVDLVANKNWQIKYVSMSNSLNPSDGYESLSYTRSFYNGINKVSFSYPSYKVKGSGSVYVEFQNKQTGGYINLRLPIAAKTTTK